MKHLMQNIIIGRLFFACGIIKNKCNDWQGGMETSDAGFCISKDVKARWTINL